LKLLSAEFVTTLGQSQGLPRDGIAQIAFAGRSNVGKSTLLNALCRRQIARTSAAPGKTRLVNVYRAMLDGGPGGPGRWSVYLVDLPGYGYARGGAEAGEELRAVAEAYFHAVQTETPDARRFSGASDGVAVTLLLIDSRHPGLDSDLAAAQWLDELGIRWQVVATKLDKLSRGERSRNLREIERTLGRAALPVSAATGEGMDELWQTIAKSARK
jgi:GTP-binding protein